MSEATVEEGRRPRLAPWYRLVQEPDRLLLEHGGSLVTFEGKAAGLLLPRLLPLLDGSRSVEEIVTELGAPIEPSVRKAIALLDEHALLLDGDGAPVEAPGGTASYAAAATGGRTTPGSAASRLAEARTGVAGRSRTADAVAGLLGEAGVAGVERGGPELADADLELIVAAPDASETGLLPEVNARTLEHGRPWLQVVPHDGRAIVVGPLFLPGRSACHECYRLRRAACSGYEDDFELVQGVAGRAPEPAALAFVAAGVAALLAVRWLATSQATLPGRATTITTRWPLELDDHHVLRVPRCPACGTGLESLPSPWYKHGAADA